MVSEDFLLSVRLHQPVEEVPGLSNVLGVLGDTHGIAAEERGGLAFLGARDRSNADLEAAVLLSIEQSSGGGVRVRHNADLAVRERSGPGGAGLFLGACTQAVGGVGQLLVSVQDALHGVVVQGGLGAILVHDGFAVSPHGREEVEDQSTTGLTGEVGACDAILVEGGDLLGLLDELVDALRTLLRVQTGFLVQVLVPDHHGNVSDERQGVLGAINSTGFDVALLQVGLVVQAIDLLGDVGEDALGSPVRNTDHVAGEDVRQGVGLRSAADLAFHIVVRDDLELDLVLVALVVSLDHVLGLTLQRGTGPQGDLGTIVGALGRDTFGGATIAGATTGGQRNDQRGGSDASKSTGQFIERHHVRFFLYISAQL